MQSFMADGLARLLRGIAGGVLIGAFALLALALFDTAAGHATDAESDGLLGKPEYVSWQIGALFGLTFALFPLPARWPWLWAVLRATPFPIVWMLLVSAQEGLGSGLHRADPPVFDLLFIVPMLFALVPWSLWRDLLQRNPSAAEKPN